MEFYTMITTENILCFCFLKKKKKKKMKKKEHNPIRLKAVKMH